MSKSPLCNNAHASANHIRLALLSFTCSLSLPLTLGQANRKVYKYQPLLISFRSFTLSLEPQIPAWPPAQDKFSSHSPLGKGSQMKFDISFSLLILLDDKSVIWPRYCKSQTDCELYCTHLILFAKPIIIYRITI